MEQKSSSRDIFIKEMPGLSAEPAALGLFGLGVAALLLGVTYLDFASSASKSLLLPWILFFGATAQLIAGLIDFKRNNIFGATVFSAFAMTMYTIALTLFITIFTTVNFDLKHYGFGLVGVLAIAGIATICSLLTNKVLFTILVVVDVAVVVLISHYLLGTSGFLAGILLLVTSALSFYAAMAVLFNTMAGKPFFPMGKPLWKP